MKSDHPIRKELWALWAQFCADGGIRSLPFEEQLTLHRSFNSDTYPTPRWRHDAIGYGVHHEREVTLAIAKRQQATGECPHHGWRNADSVGRCFWCGEPVPNVEPPADCEPV